MSDKLIYGLLVTLFSMGIVFVVLVVLRYVIKLESFTISKIGKEKSEPEKSEVSEITDDNINIIEDTDSIEDDMEIVAAIMGAISAYTGLSTSGFNIKSIKRVNGNDSNWRNAALKLE